MENENHFIIPESSARKYTPEELDIIQRANMAAKTTPAPESPDALRRRRLGEGVVEEWTGPHTKRI